MTLLLNLAGPRGIHQSSDFRLTDVGTKRSILDELGSKQLEHLTSTWGVRISFTGFAKIGNRSTGDWLLDTLKAPHGSADAAMAEVAVRAAAELRRVPQKDWFLTIVATVIEGGQASRLLVVSCVDRPSKPPLKAPLDHFEVHEISTSNPQVLIFGCVSSVTKADRKFLEKLNRGQMEPAEIRRCLARVNARSAKRSGGFVSEGCLVSSTTLDGRVAFENFGATPGAIKDLAGSSQILGNTAKAQKDKRPALVQGRAAATVGAKEVTLGPMNVSEGNTLVVKAATDSPLLFVTDSNGNTFRCPPRFADTQAEEAEWAKLEEGLPAGSEHRLTFSSSSRSAFFNGPDGSRYGLMEVAGLSGEAVLVKNRVTKITLCSVVVRILSASQHPPQPLGTTWDIRSVLTIGGVQPHGWGYYKVDMILDALGGTIAIQHNAVALRSKNFACPLPFCRESEELIVVSSTRPLRMKISDNETSASGLIEARLFLRDAPSDRIPHF